MLMNVWTTMRRCKKKARVRLGAHPRRVKTLGGIHGRIVSRSFLALSWMEPGRRY